MIPIQAAFKLAKALACYGLRSAYEHNDTVLYTLCAGGALAEIGMGRSDLLPCFLLVSMAREFTRMVSWLSFNEPRLVGDKSKPIDTINYALAAGVALCGVSGAFGLDVAVVKAAPTVLPDAAAMFTFGAGFSSWFAFRGGRLKDFVNAYFDKSIGMWDWPSKNRNGGTPSQEFDNSVEDIVSTCIDANAGPAPEPIPVPKDPRDRRPHLQRATQRKIGAITQKLRHQTLSR